jgi:Transmembrane domain of unknown function (DUF3566)
VDKQVDPAARVAEEPGGAVPKLDTAVPESSTGETESKPNSLAQASTLAVGDAKDVTGDLARPGDERRPKGNGKPLGSAHPDSVFTPAAVTKPHSVPKPESAPPQESKAGTGQPGSGQVGASPSGNPPPLPGASPSAGMPRSGAASPSAGVPASTAASAATVAPAAAAGLSRPSGAPSSSAEPTATTNTAWKTQASRTTSPTAPGAAPGPAFPMPAADRDSTPQPRAIADSSLRTLNQLSSRVAAPFLRVGKNKKLRPSALGRPGGAVGNGRPAMTVKSRPGAPSKSATQLAPKRVRPDGTEARDAQLVLSRIEPWSVMKFSFMTSIVGFVVLMVAVSVLYFFFSALGVFHSIEHTIGLVTSSAGHAGSNAASWFSAGTVLGYTMAAGAIDVVLITALATVGAVIYNAVSRVSGGIEITLKEAD